jgi:hypothetical protein
MQMQSYDIVGSYNNQRVSSIDSERSVNVFEYIDPLGKKAKSLLSTSGIERMLNAVFPGNTGGFRGQFVFKGKMYVVVGSKIYSLSESLVPNELGTLETSAGYVGIDANINQLIFVDGTHGYIYDVTFPTETGGLQRITDPDFPTNPIDVAFLDGFFVVPVGGTNTFRLSSLNNGLIWGPVGTTVNSNTFTADPATDLITLTTGTTANYATGTPVQLESTGTMPSPLNDIDTFYVILVNATQMHLSLTLEDAFKNIYIDILSAGSGTHTITNDGQLQQGEITSHPGNIVACRTLHRRLFLFSDFYTEVWENAGFGTNLPFRRNNSLLMEYGTPSRASIAVGFDSMFFLSQDRDGLGSVMQVLGTESIPISNRALDFQFAQYVSETDTDGLRFINENDPRGFLIKENGIIFYRLNFTLANHTYVFNVSMSDRENLRWHEEELLNGDRHPAQTHAYFNGVNYVGSYNEPILYRVDSELVTNDGESIRRMRIAKPFVPEGYNRIRIDRFHIDVVQGKVDEEILAEEPILTEFGLDLLTESEDELVTEREFTIVDDGQPHIFLSISRDGGQSYGNQIKAPMGKIGERTYRSVWRKLGTIPRGQSFVPRFQFFNRVPFQTLGAAWAFEVLPE